MRVFFLMLFLLFFTACNDRDKEEIKIATNEWIGYAPIFYANEKGWLKSDNIRLLRTVSLGESLKLFKSGYVNSFCATQYEYQFAKDNVYPVILLDKSNGGDMILANKSLKKLLKSSKIDVYLEIESVNYLLLKYFAKKYNISMDKFILHDFDQNTIYEEVENKNNVIVVTYSPYDINFIKKGFIKIASSKEKDLLIIDAVFASKEISKIRFNNLKHYIDKAIEQLKKDPKEFFEVVKLYYKDYTYKDFMESLDGVKWINNPSKELLKIIKDKNIKTKSIL